MLKVSEKSAHEVARKSAPGGAHEVGTWEQPLTVYGKEQSLRKSDADELKFGEEQGGIGSASAAHEVARPIFSRDR
jgi:hypothetical protein